MHSAGTLRSRFVVVLAAAAVLAATLAVLLLDPGRTRAQTPAVAVFPTPGDPVANPATQITFRGIPIDQLGAIVVTGSRSGVHTGHLAADSDGDGGSFIPDKPFTTGETVTVNTSQTIAGVGGGTFSFKIATPAGSIPAGAPFHAPRVRGDEWRFVTQPRLRPAAVHITRRPRQAAPGDVFLAPQAGPEQWGPEILGPWGGLIWFHPLPKNQSATDFRVQTYQGKPVLTWWQGNVSGAGTGNGAGEIYDTSYRQVATVHAGNGLSADLHEFLLTPQNTALITAYYPVIWNASAVKRGSKHEIVLDSVIQEIDIPTGLVLFQWDSLTTVPVTYSYQPVATSGNNPWDYFHINSIQLAPDGSILVSSRDTWAVYDLNPQTGQINWELNGKHSSFKMGAGTTFAFQHDARLQPNDEITLFDDGAGPPPVHKQSRALTLRLDMTHHTATLVSSFEHRPGLLAFYEGNVQTLSNGDQFVGWGQQPYFTEFNAHGQVVFDGRFVDANSNYRAYKFQWTGTPAYRPSITVRAGRGGRRTVYVSWNGASLLQRWQLLGGSSATALKPLETVHKHAFESAYRVPSGVRYLAAQGLDSHGNPLGTSATVKVP